MEINLNQIESFAEAILSEISRPLSWSDEIISTSVPTSTLTFRVEKGAYVVGLDVAKAIFSKMFARIATIDLAIPISKQISVELKTLKLNYAESGEEVLRVTGPTRVLLAAEPIALNILNQMSAVYASAISFMHLLQNTNTQFMVHRTNSLDTRSFLEKYALILAGVRSQRFGQSESVQVRRSHVMLRPSLTDLMEELKQSLAPTVKVEVAISSLDQLQEAIDAGADLLHLESLSFAEIAMAVRTTRNRCKIEVSGLESVDMIVPMANLCVDFISSDIILRNTFFHESTLNFKSAYL